MWWQLCIMEAGVPSSRMFNVVSSFECVVHLIWYDIGRTLKFSICGTDHKVCIHTENVCNEEVFQIVFPQLVWEAKYERSVHSWWKKYVILNIVSVKNMLLFCNSVFPMWHSDPQFRS
jgi:hypothetical protein